MTAATDLANTVSTALLTGTDFTVDLPDLDGTQFQVPPNTGINYGSVSKLDNADLTSGESSLTGSGLFDVLMKAFKAHLKKEFEENRISGAEYTKAYTALVESALTNATSFLMQQEASYWSSINAQLQARIAEVGVVTARVQLEAEKTKLQVLRFQALEAQSAYALNKLRLARENVEYDASKYNLDNLLPLQKRTAEAEAERAELTLVTLGFQNERAELDVEAAEIANSIAEKQVLLTQSEVDMINNRLALLAGEVTKQAAETTNITKQGVLLDDEHDLNTPKLTLLEKQILQAVAETTNVGKQGTLLDDEHALASKKADLLDAQVSVAEGEALLAPQKLALLIKQVANQEAQTQYTTKQTEAAQAEIDLYPAKQTLLEEQAESQRAQTLDTRSNGTTVSGTMGMQRQLYAQQIESYQRDAEVKAAKIFSDAWITMKTIDEGLSPPTSFSNANLDAILNSVKTNNDL